jgi:preprotein translocase subunit SecD
MTSVKKLFLNWKVMLLLISLVLALVSIQPQLFGNDGVTIRSVSPNSSAANAGLENPSARSTPLAKERILSINGAPVNSVDEYVASLSTLISNTTARIETNERVYTLVTREDPTDLGVEIFDAPTSNIRKGLDLEGGTRVLLEPSEQISEDDLDITISSLKERLNVYGLSDIVIRAASDLAGDSFILIEIAGVTEEEVRELLSRQGKFEAKIGEESVFLGGDKDITYVCRSAQCSGIDPNAGCGPTGDGFACRFFFAITLSPDAAQRHADVTRDIPVVTESGSAYLSEDLHLFLDDVEVDTLRVGADLKGRVTTNIQISGSGYGRTTQEAQTNTLLEMKKLQTVIITGSLPVSLNIVKIDTISPSLGQEFLDNILLVGLLAILSVITVIYIRYRKLKIVLPMVLTLLSELVLILGFASLVGWNLDLAGIAGIIIAVGTGVDHLIVITDETIKGETISNWKRKIKNAMFIVMGAYLTTLAGMTPLLWAGAGLLKGFALTTIAGISFGVLIARPAYAVIIEKLLSE